MPHFKSEFPDFSEKDSLSGKVEKLIEFTRQLNEQLGFILGNLNASNLNGANLAISVRSGNGREEYGSMGAVEGGVGLRSGSYALRVSAGGIELSSDGGSTWRKLEGVTEE